MRCRQPAVLLSILLCGACGRRTPLAQFDVVKVDVESFVRSVAGGVTKTGPAAWQGYFEDSRSFFMAADGQVQFVDGAAARAAIPELARTIQKIELQWGDG